jgi:hypothetical protein
MPHNPPVTEPSPTPCPRVRRPTFLNRHPYWCVAMFVTGVLLALRFWPMPHAQTYTGVVLDDATGQPIPGIEVTAKWELADYPMLDGGSNYYVIVSAKTDADGKFVLPRSFHRRALLLNRFEGLSTFDLHSPYITYYNDTPGDYTVIRLKKGGGF